jgi:hypothetical protein
LGKFCISNNKRSKRSTHKENNKTRILKNKKMDIEQLKNQITKAASELMTLKIRTIVGPMAIDANNKVHTKIDPDKLEDSKAIMSSISLIDGDITTKMDREFADGDFQSLRTFHMDNEAKGREIINENLKILKQLASFVKEELSNL